MERRGAGKRVSKSAKNMANPLDLIALGRSEGHDKPGGSSKAGSSHSLTAGGDRKREAPSSSFLQTKKQKTAPPGLTPLGARQTAEKSQERAGPGEAWEVIAEEVEPSDLVIEVMDADKYSEEKVEALLCGAVKQLRSHRAKPEQPLYLSLVYLAKVRPSFFCTDGTVTAFCSLLRRDMSINFKAKGNALVSVLAANVLMAAFQDEKNWPEIFVKVYLEDAMGERVWVDHELCKTFVDNICTAFNTVFPPKVFLQSDGVGAGVLGGKSDCPSSPPGTHEVLMDVDVDIAIVQPRDKADVRQRYTHMQEIIEKNVVDVAKEQLSRRQPIDNITRNFLRLLCTTAGIAEVRLLVAPRLELWLQNAKLMRSSQDLLMFLCVNTTSTIQSDVDVISHLVKIRVKTKALLNHYLTAIKELLMAHHSNLAKVLKYTIYNELSNSRNPNNMQMVSVMFQSRPEDSAGVLSEVFQELLMNREDYLRALRALLREIVRFLRWEFPLLSFCCRLIVEPQAPAFRDLETNLKERMFLSIVDLITLAIILGVSPAVKEAAQTRKDLQPLQAFQQQAADIQQNAIFWLYSNSYHPGGKEAAHALHKLLFFESLEQYHKIDNWPPEVERTPLLRLAGELPVRQKTLFYVLIMGMRKEHPISPVDALDMADKLIHRAAALSYSDVLHVDRKDIVDLIFNLSAYNHPENLCLPSGYIPPKMAIITLYWKAWIMLLIITAHNPTTFGHLAWEVYPTLRALMEMCITNHFVFPPLTMAVGEKAEEMKKHELEMSTAEKNQILELESHLAAVSTKVTITESTSLLLSQLTSMDPSGVVRRPPQTVLDQLKAANVNFKIGNLLCRSRNPDFLLDILQRQHRDQGPSSQQAMPWLAELVQSSEGSFSLLPVQCLCEFLLSDNTDDSSGNRKQLLLYLQTLLQSPSQSNPQTSREVIEYFLKRLVSQQAAARIQAIQGLRLVLAPLGSEEMADKSESGWLLRRLPSTPHFQMFRSSVIDALKQACLVETNLEALSAYILFLAQHATQDPVQEMADMVLDMAQLIVERNTVTAAILPQPGIHASIESELKQQTLVALLTIFSVYMKKAREPEKGTYFWTESQDQIVVRWSTGEEATMHILVAHAIVILLTFGTPQHEPELFWCLVEMWFPSDLQNPTAFLLDTSEPAVLLPDWLRLRMIRSHVPVLVKEALVNLHPKHLVLFIQSFGVPLESVTKLLFCLDEAMLSDPEAVASAVMDKAYMTTLVEVHWKCGAQGGHRFAAMLNDKEEPEPMYTGSSSTVLSFSPKQDFPIPVRNEPVMEGDLSGPLSLILGIDATAPDVLYPHHLLRILLRSLHTELVSGSQLRRVKEVLQALEYILMSSRSKYLSSALRRNIGRPAALCRQLQQVKGRVSKMVSSLLERLASLCHDGSPLVHVIRRGNVIRRASDHRASPLPSTFTMAEITKTLNSGQETIVKKIIEEGLSKNKTDTLIEGMTRLMTVGGPSTNIFMDWFSLLEPEIVCSTPELQMGLVFGGKACDGSTYLLGLFTHHASWSRLRSCIDALLSEKHVIKYDHTAVLDFLWACMHIPKLCQGREKINPKHFQLEDIMGIGEQQVEAIVMNMLAEARDSDDPDDCIQRRMKLLLLCCADRRSHLSAALRCATRIEASKREASMAESFLLSLYLQKPSIVWELEGMGRQWEVTPVGSVCPLDALSHSLLTALAATRPGKDWQLQMQDFEIGCRKMAAVHPVLVLRQLSMVAGFLRGRTHLEFVALRYNNHIQLFDHMLGLLELLTPHCFNPHYQETLWEIMETFFELFQNHTKKAQCRDLAPLLDRVLVFLNKYIMKDSKIALQFIVKSSQLFRTLIQYYPDLDSLRNIVSCLPQRNEESVPLIQFPSHPSSHPVPLPLLLRLVPTNYAEDVTSALQELESVSAKKPDILGSAVDDIRPLMCHSSTSVRELAHTLLLRHLRHYPLQIPSPAFDYLACLDSDNPDVVISALERLGEVVILCQEHAAALLKKAFTVGVSMNVNTSSYIGEALALLNLQTGS